MLATLASIRCTIVLGVIERRRSGLYNTAAVIRSGKLLGTYSKTHPNEEAFEAVKLAYELGDQDINMADDKGYTALHGAALRGANPIVQFLVDKGADLLVETKNEGWTPLRIADGVHYTGTVKRADHTAELLRQVMKERGVYSADHERDVNSVAVVKPTEPQ